MLLNTSIRSRSHGSRFLVCRSHNNRQRRTENIEGDLWVDTTCIDCDTCRWMAPDIFTSVGSMSAVTRQPTDPSTRQAALQSLISCPTFSIHIDNPIPGELATARDSFPLGAFDGTRNVYHLGHHDRRSYGAAPYFIKRSQGNIMIDVPRWSPWLAQRLQALGGVKYLVLTHRDDVGAHQKWVDELGIQARIMHEKEMNTRQGTDKVECKLTGEGPRWKLPDGEDDVELLFTPGHTAGCISILYKPENVLFTGDHLAWSARLNRLTIFRAYNWHSVELQLQSVATLQRGVDFTVVLPGHGRKATFTSIDEKDKAINVLLHEEGYI